MLKPGVEYVCIISYICVCTPVHSCIVPLDAMVRKKEVRMGVVFYVPVGWYSSMYYEVLGIRA